MRRRELPAAWPRALQLVVGTHALIEGAVEFGTWPGRGRRTAPLRRAPAGGLDAKAPDGLAPTPAHDRHPDPRTLSLTAYGDLDTTVLRTLPKGRRRSTFVVTNPGPGARYERIREEIAAGRQCFVVCPLVEESRR